MGPASEDDFMAAATFGIFRDHPDDPVCVGMCADMQSTRATAQHFANKEHTEFFIYSFDRGKKLETFKTALPPERPKRI
jgi:hypothetical protein